MPVSTKRPDRPGYARTGAATWTRRPTSSAWSAGERGALPGPRRPRPVGLVRAAPGPQAGLRPGRLLEHGPPAPNGDEPAGRCERQGRGPGVARHGLGPPGGAARSPPRPRGPPRRRPGGRVRQAYPRQPGVTRGRPRQPRLSLRPLRHLQGLRRAHPLPAARRRQQVLEGQPLLRPQRPEGHHPGPPLRDDLRLHPG